MLKRLALAGSLAFIAGPALGLRAHASSLTLFQRFEQRMVQLSQLPTGLAQSAGIRTFVSQQQASTPGFDIESQGFHCNPGAPTCDPFGPDVTYTNASAVHFGPETQARPSYIVAVCGQGYYDANGDPHILSGHSFPGYFGGPPSGIAWLGPNPTESNTAALGVINASGYDPVNQTTGTIKGSMRFNNVTDYPNYAAGGGPPGYLPYFTVTITGVLEDDNLANNTSSYHQGTITCNTRFYDLIVPPPEDVNEAEYETPADDD